MNAAAHLQDISKSLPRESASEREARLCIEQPGAIPAFEAFAERAQASSNPGANRKRNLSDVSAAHYKRVWTLWLDHLVNQSTAWRVATATDVDNFVNTIGSRWNNLDPDGRTQSSSNGSKVSKERYRRVLERVYSDYLFMQPESPANINPASREDTEGRNRENVPSLVLSPTHLAALELHLPAAIDVQSSRDRALLCLLMKEALTYAEASSLRLAHVLWPDPSAAGQPATGSMPLMATPATRLLPPTGLPQKIQVKGKRKAQTRTLDLDTLTAQAIATWLGFRQHTPYKPSTDHLLVGVGSNRCGKLGASAAFVVCREFVKSASKLEYLMPRGELPWHVGPNTLRNSCMQRWLLEGVSGEEVRRRCGLAQVRSVRRIGVTLPEDPPANTGRPSA
jgi:integrase